MSKTDFFARIGKELEHTSKRKERVAEEFTKDPSPRAVIGGSPYLIFNSNDYLGLRFHPALAKAEHDATLRFGAGPGAVRFISGTLGIHRELERALAAFHGREDAMLFSSAFAANLGALSVLCKGDDVFVVSDELNHRSIIDGIRLSGVGKEQKSVFKHLDAEDLRRVLEEGKERFTRAVVVTDGVFSMLGEVAGLKELRRVVDAYDPLYPEGVLFVVDDCHGVGAVGERGRGTEEVFGVPADLLVGTLGKSLGSDGGYVTGSKLLLDHLRENASTYIYSNPISPGTAGAGIAAVKLLDTNDGIERLLHLRRNVAFFKEEAKKGKLILAADSDHPIQPLLIGDTAKTRLLADGLFAKGILVTPINFPVVPKGRDEIRIQISALHTNEDIVALVDAIRQLL